MASTASASDPVAAQLARTCREVAADGTQGGLAVANARLEVAMAKLGEPAGLEQLHADLALAVRGIPNRLSLDCP